jgi:ribosomal-protein-alanine N-acetyltransferase
MLIDLPHLRGERVALRPLEPADAGPYVAAFAADPGLGRLLGLEQDPDEAGVWGRIATQEQRAADGLGAQLAVVAAEPDGAFLGSVTLHSLSWPNRRGELGFWVVPEHRREGIAASALELAIGWALDSLDLLRIEMTTTPENPAVPGLARRLGFTHEGTLRARNIERGQRVDILHFGLLREEWRR